MHTPKVLFLLADGARARLVERSAENGDFVTFEEIDARPRLNVLRQELRASPPGRSFERAAPTRHDVGREDPERSAKEAFVAEVAEKAAIVARRRGFQSVFVAAPARLIGLLRERLSAKAEVVGALARDLTNAPDAALGRWLHQPTIAP